MYANGGKRVLDVCLSLFLLLILWPLILLAALIGALVLRENPFFLQQRPGKIDPKTGQERLFYVIKLRSMRDVRGADGAPLPDAARTPRYGALLRKTGVDELPQLWNILCGQMSFVGPRPLLPEYLSLYTPQQRLRHTVRPGLTGLAQICGGTALSLEQKTALDVQYVSQITLRGDLLIMARTLGVLVRRMRRQGNGGSSGRDGAQR